MQIFDDSYKKNLEESITGQARRLKENLSAQFEEELSKAKECVKQGDMLTAHIHRHRAGMLSNMLNGM
jgi:hypothetical protein